jgi:cyanate permease
LLDRFFAPLIVVVFLSLQAVGAFGLLVGVDGSAAIVAIMMIGLGIGAEMDFMSYLVSRYFGLKAFSRLYGLTYAAITVGVSIGPIVMGYSQQLSGNYQFGLQVLFVCATAAIFPLLILGAYPDLPGSEPAE